MWMLHSIIASVHDSKFRFYYPRMSVPGLTVALKPSHTHSTAPCPMAEYKSAWEAYPGSALVTL